ncbi:MAG: MarR family transcriptional regulator [Desulfobacterales bacterium]|nr:MarR family transcriptional regulator [Desulfobacterales bacterium]
MHTVGCRHAPGLPSCGRYDLTPEQWEVLVRIQENEGMNQSQLGEKAFQGPPQHNRIIDLLEGRGFIERRPDDTDRRAYRLYLTKSGRDVQEALTSVVQVITEVP